MKIDCLVLGPYETNCYVLRRSDAVSDCLIIDPGLGGGVLIEFLRKHELKPVAVILTHGHIDHIAGLAQLHQSANPGIRVYIHELDAEMLGDPEANLSAVAGCPFTSAPTQATVADGDRIEQAGIKLRVLHVPGHTPGGICLYCEEDGVVFTDDALFAESIGRSDFPGGDMRQLVTSIKQKLCVLPDNTVVYSGHGPSTTIGREKAHNPFL